MEKIYKKICVEPYRSRTPGLMPYIPFNKEIEKGEIHYATEENGNWGQYVFDFYDENGNKVRYCELMHRYFSIRKVLENGIKCHVMTKNGQRVYIQDTDDIDDYTYIPVPSTNYSITPEGYYIEIEKPEEESDEEDVVEVEENELAEEEEPEKERINIVSEEDYNLCKEYGGIETCEYVEELVGLIHVPKVYVEQGMDREYRYPIDGALVPKYIYASDVQSMIDWFKRNEDKAKGRTITWYALGGVNPFTEEEILVGWIIDPYSLEAGQMFPMYDAVNGHPTMYECVSVTITSEEGGEEGVVKMKITVKYLSNGVLTIHSVFKIAASKINKDCCIEREWNMRGGDNMLRFLIAHADDAIDARQLWGDKEDLLCPPTIDIPILLTQDISDLGTQSPYNEDEKYVETDATLYVWVNRDQSSEIKVIYTEEPIFSVDGEVLFKTSMEDPQTASQCTEFIDRDGRKEMVLYGIDGSFVFGHVIQEKYNQIVTHAIQDITTESKLKTLWRAQKTYDDNGDLCPFYKNGSTIEIPYTITDRFNEYAYTDENGEHEIYDQIITIELLDEEGNITLDQNEAASIYFQYVLGYMEDSSAQDGFRGIVYEEKIPCAMDVYNEPVDGTTGISYLNILYDNSVTTIYNREYNLSRDANIANIEKYDAHEVWDIDNETTTTAGFKMESLDRVSETPDIKVDVEVNRGNATAFERHMKLGEINTFADLKNYGNNYFGL